MIVITLTREENGESIGMKITGTNAEQFAALLGAFKATLPNLARDYDPRAKLWLVEPDYYVALRGWCAAAVRRFDAKIVDEWTRPRPSQAPPPCIDVEVELALRELHLLPSALEYPELVKLAYRILASKFHPDRADGDGEQMRSLTAAIPGYPFRVAGVATCDAIPIDDPEFFALAPGLLLKTPDYCFEVTLEIRIEHIPVEIVMPELQQLPLVAGKCALKVKAQVIARPIMHERHPAHAPPILYLEIIAFQQLLQHGPGLADLLQAEQHFIIMEIFVAVRRLPVTPAVEGLKGFR